MENDIYFEGVYISYQTISLFEEMYENKKQEIMNDLKKKRLTETFENLIDQILRSFVDTPFVPL